MLLVKIVRAVIPLVVLGIVSEANGDLQNPLDTLGLPTVPAVGGVGDSPEVSSSMMKLFDVLGITSKTREKLPHLNIPDDLTNASKGELENYTKLLLDQRRHLQRRMTRYMLYNIMLMAMLKFFGDYSLVKGSVAAAYYLNNNYRETINADWVTHQLQLGLFIVEYSRVKGIKLDSLSNNFLVGAPVMDIPYAEDAKATFPVWLTKKGQTLPKDAEITGYIQLARHWRLRK